MTTTETNAANCPVCEAGIPLPSDTMLGEILPCDDCGAELEVLELKPARVGVAPEVHEDWGE